MKKFKKCVKCGRLLEWSVFGKINICMKCFEATSKK